jgi:hypothetical protein
VIPLKKFAAVMVVGVALSGCSTMSQSEHDAAVKGALIGGIAGGAIGAVATGNFGGAAVGAGIGAAVGAAIATSHYAYY